MRRRTNIVLIAIVAFFTLAELNLAVSDSLAIQNILAFLARKCYVVVQEQDKYIESPLFALLTTHPTPTLLLDKEIVDIAANCLPPDSPYSMFELSAPIEHGSMVTSRIRLARAYQAYVFETLKSFFMNLQTYIAARNPSNRALLDALAYVWDALQVRLSLEAQYHIFGTGRNPRELKLPDYVAGPNSLATIETTRLQQIFHKARLTSQSRITVWKAHIDRLRDCLKDAMIKLEEVEHRDCSFRRMTGRLLGSERNTRFNTLESTSDWARGWSYGKLNEVPTTELRWLTLRVAHERLIIDRALYDMKRLHFYELYFRKNVCGMQDKVDTISNLRAEYEEFIGGHAEKIRLYEQTLRGGDIAGDTNVAVPHTTNDGITQTHLQDDSSTRQHLMNFNVAERHQDGSDSPPPELIDFLGIADGKALGSSLGTYTSERYEDSTSRFEEPLLSLSSIHYHAAESTKPSHNDRNKGKRPMHDVGLSLSYPAHNAYGRLDDESPRKKQTQ
ncbi:hypothetical protein SeLEV6574_g03729 [Synchytrium endobioticum]|uniref:Myosin-binding domain-containing protein n=1 Tax=Synchytrium endobioticum TaxID=286115 RepID=A0A507D2H7_9FUNG|nr:hypothetical protein SeLEV6574_g03729 [Synchytrium endobioticum]